MRLLHFLTIIVVCWCIAPNALNAQGNQARKNPILLQLANIDAARIAVRLELQKPIEEQQPEIPIELYDRLNKSLVNIMSSEINIANEINMLNIHTSPEVNVDELKLTFPKTWSVQKDSDGFLISGHAKIDQLLKNYAVRVQDFSKTRYGLHLITLRADNPLNTHSLMDQVLGLSSRIGKYKEEPKESLKDIMVKPFGSGYFFTYTFKWESEYGGYNQRIWNFMVYEDYSVDYKGSYGDELPIDFVIK